MSVHESDLETSERELWYKIGLEEGRDWSQIYIARVNELYATLLDMGRLEDLKLAFRDSIYREQLLNELLPED